MNAAPILGRCRFLYVRELRRRNNMFTGGLAVPYGKFGEEKMTRNFIPTTLAWPRVKFSNCRACFGGLALPCPDMMNGNEARRKKPTAPLHALRQELTKIIAN